MKVHHLIVMQIFDSHRNSTVEVDLYTKLFCTSVLSGASTDICEAVELRVMKAVANVNDTIALELIKFSLTVTVQKEIDDFLVKLDSTPNKGKLSANTILSVSIAIMMVGAAEKGVPLYQHLTDLTGVKPPFILLCPAFNVINGSSHVGNKLAFQEFMLLPTGMHSFTGVIKLGTERYHMLKKVISTKYGIDGGTVNISDEGGFTSNVSGAEESLELLAEVIKKAGYEGKIKIVLDVASSEFYKENANSDPTKWIPSIKLADLYMSYAWIHFMKNSSIQIVGDDLTTALEKKAYNGLLLKVNQIGTISGSIKVAQLMQSDGWGVMVLHRSGEMENMFIADLVVALSVGQIKSGAPAHSERVV
ncbi:enolase [Laetiporus sulphureus 93-53]|uniref:phosphopyruvate hydratase n=1 Tax=Laetiporus sulphureus 93-53 TaxID=1314785 RepID=A0A165EFL1_9APHY|nr:enolase [Laetiporus sulphureus 93-53]KZT06954.1 enolase [Laetiporus sulphureus 93-53]